MSMRKEFIVTLETEAFDDWDGIDCGAVKDAVADWTRIDTAAVTVEEISTRGQRQKVNSMLTSMVFVTEDAL